MSDPIQQTADSMMLKGFWYPALRSSQLRENLTTATLLDVPLVLGRDSRQHPFALRDSCPHRGIPLSYGTLAGDCVECCYHGWQFDVTGGQCVAIPSLTPESKLKPERIRAQHFQTREQDQYIWVYFPDSSAPQEPVPAVPELPTFSTSYRFTQLSADLACNVDNGIIGLMDPAHGPFVHQSWWWRTRRSAYIKEKTFEAIPNGYRIRAHQPSANSAPYKLLRIYGEPITTVIEFILPNIRLETIRCGRYWFSSRATVTPITPDHCRIDFCAAWNIFRSVPFIVSIFRLFARRFIRQDQETMEKQAEGLRHNPSMMLIDDADRPARFYFQLKEAYLKSRSTGQPMQHPITEPVLLRWRS